MNWKQLNEKYPAAFLEWVNEMFETEGNVTKVAFSVVHGFLKGRNKDDALIVSDYELSSNDLLHLPHYFDGLGIRIAPLPCAIDSGFDIEVFIGEDRFHYSVYEEWKQTDPRERNTYEMWTFPDRMTALKAGIEEAFEIREEMLKTKS